MQAFREMPHSAEAALASLNSSSGDLDQVRRIAERAAAGLFETEGRDENPERRKERLRARIGAVRESLARTRAELEALKESPSYRSAVGQADWAAYFEEQGRLLDRQIEQLSGMAS